MSGAWDNPMTLRDVLLPLDEVLAVLPAEFADGRQVLDLSWIGQAWCEDIVVSAAEPDGTKVRAEVVLQTSFDLLLADFGLLEVTIPQTDGNIESLIGLRTGSRPGLSVDVPLNLHIRQPLLRRVDLNTGAPQGDGFDLQARGVVTVDTNGPRIDFHALTAPPTMLGHTGLIVTFAGLDLVLDGNDLPGALSSIAGSGPTYLLASHATLRWLPQFVPALADLPGFLVPLRDVVIDETGVSFIVDYSWRTIQSATGNISPRSEAVGSLLNGQFRAALRRLVGEVSRNQPTGLRVEGLVEIPVLPGAADVSFFWSGGTSEESRIDVSIQHPGVEFNAGGGRIVVNQIELSGQLGNTALSIGGRANISVALPGLAIGPVGAELGLEATNNHHHFTAALLGVPLGPLGRLDRATLDLELSPTGNNWLAESVTVSADLRWSDVRAFLAIANWPASIPQPLDSAQVTVELKWDDPALDLTFRIESVASADLWTFLPSRYRPVTRRVALGIVAHFANAASFGATPPGTAVQAEVVLLAEFKPFLPAAVTTNHLLELSVPDSEGFVKAQATFTLGAPEGDRVEFQINDVLALNAFVPFLETERSFMRGEIQSLSTTLIAGSGGAADRVKLEAKGSAQIRAPRFRANDPVTQALNTLLTPLGEDGIVGTLAAVLEMDGTNSGTTFELSGTINEAQLEVDLIAVLAAIAPSDDTSGPADSFRGEVPLNTNVRFVLDAFTLRIAPPAVAGQPSVVSAEISITAEVGGASVSTVISISTVDLSVDFQAEIPLTIPRFPIDPNALADLAARPNPDWTAQRFTAKLRAIRNELERLDNESGRNEAARREERRRRAELSAQLAMFEYLEKHWKPMNTIARRNFQGHVQRLVSLLDVAKGFTQVDSNLHLNVDHCRLRVPWQAPQQIAIEGAASLHGFSPTDPYRGLEGLSLGLGLSPDQIYFTFEGSGDPIPIPDFGRYPRGTVSLARLSIGYGFTRNSLAISFAGSVNPPPQLIEDADLSDDIGFGVRLPSHNSLAFRLDLIPVPGPVPVVPAGEFALDLRTPGLPGIRNTAGCAPVWDGLQIHIPNLFHLGFKQTSISPMFGLLPAFNARFDGDLELGNEETGVTVVCDDLLWIMGIGTPPVVLIVPFLFDPAIPFFENLCLNMRVLGFRLNIGIQRPFPQPNPLAIFDAISLLSDPEQPIDPDGPLANMVRVAIRETSLEIPEWLMAMVPGSRAALRNPIDFELDIATVVTCVQWLMAAARTAAQLVQSAFEAGERAVKALTAPPPNVFDLLALLPEQLRVVKADFDFAGFRGNGAIALVSIRSVLDQSKPKRSDAKPVSPAGDNRPATLLANRRVAPVLKDRFAINAPLSKGTETELAKPTIAPFNQFTAADYENLPIPPEGSDGVLVAVGITVFEIARYSFVGYVAESGHFGMVSTASVRPGVLRIAGIEARLPLQFTGRASFAGRVAPNEVRASITVGGFGVWEPIPKVVRLRIGTVRQPVEIGLSTNGCFSVQGSALVEIFGGALQLSGSVDASERHLMAKGDLALSIPREGSNQPWLEMESSGALEVGPGLRFRFEGQGDLKLLNKTVAAAHIRITENEVEIGGELGTQNLNIGGIQTQIFASISARAKLDDRGLLQMDLRGAGSITVGPASTKGSLEIRVRPTSVRLKAAGEMTWMGQKWLSAAVSVSTNGAFSLEGRTSLAIDLIDEDILGNIEVAKLFLRLDVRAAVDIDPDGGLGSYDFRLEWSIGVKLPGAQGQTFVLAMQKERFQGGGTLEVVLFNIDGISFLPGGDIQIPIPQLVPTDFRNVYATYIDLPVLDQLWFLTNYRLKEWLENNVDHVESEYLFEVPVAFEPRIEMTTLGEIAGALKFSVALVWIDNGLALAIRRDDHEELIHFNTIR